MASYLAHKDKEAVGFLLVTLSTACTFLVVMVCLAEDKSTVPRSVAVSDILHELKNAWNFPTLRWVVIFLFLLHFNPFSFTVLYLHSTQQLGISEQAFGTSSSLSSIGGLLASLLSGYYGSRWDIKIRLCGSTTLNMLTSLCFLWLEGPWSLYILMCLQGYTGMLALLVQLELAGNATQTQGSGTVFACLMSAQNASTALSTYLGGLLYSLLLTHSDSTTAFRLLVGLGSLCTLACLFLIVFCASALSSDSRLPAGKGTSTQHEESKVFPKAVEIFTKTATKEGEETKIGSRERQTGKICGEHFPLELAELDFFSTNKLRPKPADDKTNMVSLHLLQESQQSVTVSDTCALA